jgi:hypothetical protein
VPKSKAAEATNKRHVLLILTPFNQRADTQCNAQPQANRSPKLVTAGRSRRVRSGLLRNLAARGVATAPQCIRFLLFFRRGYLGLHGF